MDVSNGSSRHIHAVPDEGNGASDARRPIGEIFVELGFVSRADLETALDLQRANGGQIGEILVEQGSLRRIDLASALAEHWEPDAFAAGESLEASLNGAVRSATEQTVALQTVDPTVAELGRSLAGLSSVRVADALATGTRFATAEAAIAELEARLQAQIDETAALQRRFEEAQEELHVETGSLAGRLDELFGLRHADAQVARVGNQRLTARLDDLTASQADDEALARLEAEVSELTRRVEQIDSLDGEAARTIERAVLAGLADLGKQLTAKATKHGKPSKRLRRSIESLGVAVAAADARLAESRRSSERSS